MASPVEFTTDLPKGLKRKVGTVVVEGKTKKLITAKGFTDNRCTLIGDSIIKHLQDFLYTSVQAIPGVYANHILELCRSDKLKVRNFKAIIILAGTNDLSQSSPKEIEEIFINIITYLREVNPEARIAIGGILPRPCDRLLPTKLKAREQANALLAALSKRINIHYIKTEIAIKDKAPVHIIYESDRLHLTPEGSEYLRTYLGGRISSLIGIPRQWDPVTKAILPR
jgi:hypothetical protein